MADIVIVETFIGAVPKSKFKHVQNNSSSNPSSFRVPSSSPLSPRGPHSPLQSAASVTSCGTITSSVLMAGTPNQVQQSSVPNDTNPQPKTEEEKETNVARTNLGKGEEPKLSTPETKETALLRRNSSTDSAEVQNNLTPTTDECKEDRDGENGGRLVPNHVSDTTANGSSSKTETQTNHKLDDSIKTEPPQKSRSINNNNNNINSDSVVCSTTTTTSPNHQLLTENKPTISSVSLPKDNLSAPTPLVSNNGANDELSSTPNNRLTPKITGGYNPSATINTSKITGGYNPSATINTSKMLIPRITQDRGCGDPSCPLRRRKTKLSRSMSLPANSEVWGVVRPNTCDGRRASWSTLLRHYYPEGGWGWVVLGMATATALLAHGLQTSYGALMIHIIKRFKVQRPWAGALGALSTSLALFISPITISVCRRKSTRLTAVLGGLVTALGCLFTSFASQYHQLYFSYGTVIGIGVGLTRDSSCLMVGQYFKRRREAVEVLVVGGSGLGISAMSAFIKGAINSLGWAHGLQAVTGAVFLTFLMGTFYRSASLYHPQRRAILHLKNQKRKVKEKSRQEERIPFFDITTLRSRTIQILLVSTSLSSFGITTPILYMAQQAEEAGLEESSVVLLQTYLGLGWFAGCATFGFLTVHRSTECRIGLQYLCQAAMFLCGVTCLAFTAVDGYPGYVLFSWLYGIFCGGFHYALKMFTYEKVRARNFARTWGFVQFSQAIPTALGVPITGYINIEYGNKAGYYFSSTFIIFGSMTIFLIDVHRRRAARHKHGPKTGRQHTCVRKNCPESRTRKDSLAGMDPEPPLHAPSLASLMHKPKHIVGIPDTVDGRNKPELTCISEEGIADMDLPDHLLEELDYLGDCITSCDKVENYLMRSEYENNLIIKTGENVLPNLSSQERKHNRFKRTFSIRGVVGGSTGGGVSSGNELDVTMEENSQRDQNGKVGTTGGTSGLPTLQEGNGTYVKYTPQKHITVIEEASV